MSEIQYICSHKWVDKTKTQYNKILVISLNFFYVISFFFRNDPFISWMITMFYFHVVQHIVTQFNWFVQGPVLVLFSAAFNENFTLYSQLEATILEDVFPRPDPCTISIEQPDMPQNPQTLFECSINMWEPICFLIFFIYNLFLTQFAFPFFFESYFSPCPFHKCLVVRNELCVNDFSGANWEVF